MPSVPPSYTQDTWALPLLLPLLKPWGVQGSPIRHNSTSLPLHTIDDRLAGVTGKKYINILHRWEEKYAIFKKSHWFIWPLDHHESVMLSLRGSRKPNRAKKPLWGLWGHSVVSLSRFSSSQPPCSPGPTRMKSLMLAADAPNRQQEEMSFGLGLHSPGLNLASAI